MKIRNLAVGIIIFFIIAAEFPRALAQEPKEDTRFHVDGDFDFINQKFHLSVLTHDNESAKDTEETKETIQFNLDRAQSDHYTLLLKLSQLHTPLFDFSSEIQGETDILRNEKTGESVTSGWMRGHYTLLNYKPFDDFSGSFEIRDKVFYLKSFNFGNIAVSGELALYPPYKINVVFQLNRIPMEDFINFWMTKEKFAADGLVSGEIRASGPLNRPVLRCNLKSQNGFVHTLNFDSIHLIAEGVYPYIHIFDSTLTQPYSLSIMFDGKIDLSDQDNFKKQLKALNVMPLVSEDGTQWTIRNLTSQENKKTKIKYLLRKDQWEGSSSDQRTGGLLGVQGTMEF